ncbi:SBBP repeat-containing protein [Pontibacter ruber]|uniref:SBBP repeat-containing protein n=1 Tax=Pontibacter ruber TaxID=1343895 RepID=A0ABW5D0Y2_9BACT|nr:SBBP repeat-containing protein [Pontibacter ruber]
MISILPNFLKGMLLQRFLLFLPSLILYFNVAPAIAQKVAAEWEQRYNGQGQSKEYFQSSAMDKEGNLYLTGTSYGAPAFRFGASREHGEILTVKYAPSGEVLWSNTFVADSSRDIFEYSEVAYGIAVDESGGVYVSGVRQIQTSDLEINQKVILFRLNTADGAQVWNTTFSVENEVFEPAAITADRSGGVYLTGTSYRTFKFDARTGSRIWSARYTGAVGSSGGSETDIARAIVVDEKGGVVVTGRSFLKFLYHVGHGPALPVYSYATVKFDAATGASLWEARYTGDTTSTVENDARAMALDSAGDVYVTGTRRGTVADEGLVTIKYSNSSGEQLWTSRNSNGYESNAIVTDDAGGVYITGSSYQGSMLHDALLTVKYSAASGQQLWENKHPKPPGAGYITSRTMAVGKANDVYVAGISGDQLHNTGYTTIRYNAASGSTQWRDFYRVSLSRGNLNIHLNSNGNVFVAGSAFNEGFANSDYVLLRYAAATGGQPEVNRYEALDNANETAIVVAVDETGNTYVAGISFMEFSVGTGIDLVIVAYAPTGEVLWEKRVDKGSEDRPSAIALDDAGGIYITGSAGDQGTADYLTMKLQAADGAVVWESFYDSGDKEFDSALGLALDGSGGVYVTGMSYKKVGATSNSDYATIKYDAETGAQVWVTRFDGGLNLSDEAYAIAADSAGGVYVTGGAAFQPDDYNGKDFATLKYNAANGEQLWLARYDGGVGFDAAVRIAVANNQDVYVAGQSTGADTLVKYTTIRYTATDGKQLWLSDYKTANETAVVKDMAVDDKGGVYVTGYSYSYVAGQLLYADYATVKYNAVDGAQRWVQRFGERNTISNAAALAVDKAGDVYVTGQQIMDRDGGRAGVAATLKYKGEDGTPQWTALTAGIDDSGNDIAVDAKSNIYVAGSSYSTRTFLDLLTIKYRQGAACVPVAARAIAGQIAIRAGTPQRFEYSLTGAGATLFTWAVTGEESIALSGQGSDKISVAWPASACVYEVRASYSAGVSCTVQDTSLTVAVFDPNAGFVVGAGWLESPVAIPLEPMQQTGRAYFAFAAWYGRDGRSVQGQTAFRLSTAGLDFRSSQHTPMRLVIAGNRANYTGQGMLNGQVGYGFLVSAVDGDLAQGRLQDRLRVKVWNLATGEIAYDLQTGAGEGAIASTAISRGQIVIHRPLGRPLDLLASEAEQLSQELALLEPEQTLTVYPTAFSDRAITSFTLPFEEAYTLELYDLKGALVRHIASSRAEARQRQEHVIEATGLPGGIYLLRLSTASTSQAIKLLIKP